MGTLPASKILPSFLQYAMLASSLTTISLCAVSEMFVLIQLAFFAVLKMICAWKWLRCVSGHISFLCKHSMRLRCRLSFVFRRILLHLMESQLSTIACLLGPLFSVDVLCSGVRQQLHWCYVSVGLSAELPFVWSVCFYSKLIPLHFLSFSYAVEWIWLFWSGLISIPFSWCRFTIKESWWLKLSHMSVVLLRSGS